MDTTAFYLWRISRLQWESLSQADTVTGTAEKGPDIDQVPLGDNPGLKHPQGPCEIGVLSKRKKQGLNETTPRDLMSYS